MLRPIRSILIATAFALAIMSASTVLAAPATWDRVDVTLHAEQAGGVLLVAGELPEKAALPAEGELSVPAGAKLQWIGEVLGGPANADPELKYTKVTKDGVDVYRFTLTKARTAQVEVLTTGAPFDGTNYTPAIKWTAAQAIPAVRLNIRVPASATVAQTPPGVTPQPADDGYVFYTKSAENVKAGDELGLTFAYSVPAGAVPVTGATKQASSDGTTLAILLGAIAVIAIAVVLVSRRKPQQVVSADAAVSVDEVSAEESTDEPTADELNGEPVAASPGSSKRTLVTVAIIGALILGVVIAGAQGGKPKTAGAAITQTFAGGDACTSAKHRAGGPRRSGPGSYGREPVRRNQSHRRRDHRDLRPQDVHHPDRLLRLDLVRSRPQGGAGTHRAAFRSGPVAEPTTTHLRAGANVGHRVHTKRHIRREEES